MIFVRKFSVFVSNNFKDTLHFKNFVYKYNAANNYFSLLHTSLNIIKSISLIDTNIKSVAIINLSINVQLFYIQNIS